MSSDDVTFSRDELPHSLPTRKASMALFAIESRTAFLMERTRRALERFPTPKSIQERDNAFWKAFSEGRKPPIEPSIQDLEFYAEQWKSLAPESANMRAGVAYLLGQHYEFTYEMTPSLRNVLGLDTAEVKVAYQTMYGQALESIFRTSISIKEQFHWFRHRLAWRLETLPPFWIAYSLTFTETVGASILALPVALAGIGPLPGIVLMLILGFVNILTIMAMVESITRNGNIRYGNTFFSHLVHDYLGSLGTGVLTIALLTLIVLVLIAYYIGLATTLQDATTIPATLWALLTFAIGFYYLRRGSLSFTAASALIVGGINIGIIVIISLISLPYVHLQNLTFMDLPFVNGRPFDPSILNLVFGVVLASFFGHTSAASAAKVVLRRDPTGRSLMLGNIAALASALVLYCFWVIVVNGTIPGETLRGVFGTALSPLSDIVGPIVLILGSVFAILGMGMNTIHFSLAMFNQVREWLPDKPTKPLTNRFTDALFGQEGRFWLGLAPVAVIFLLVEWLLVAGNESFTEQFAFIGVIIVPILGGIFPILMLAASRRKGDYLPAFVFKFLGWWPVIVAVYLIFFMSILLHGLFIWDVPSQRFAAVAICTIILGMTVALFQKRLFTAKTVVELCVLGDAGEQATFNVVSKGRPLESTMDVAFPDRTQLFQSGTGVIPEFDAVTSATIKLPPTSAKALKIWLHQITNTGDTHPLAGQLQIGVDSSERRYNIAELNGEIIIDVDGGPCRLNIEFPR
jgi:hypothetical protein